MHACMTCVLVICVAFKNSLCMAIMQGNDLTTFICIFGNKLETNWKQNN
jgi:hypothetical protein